MCTDLSLLLGLGSKLLRGDTRVRTEPGLGLLCFLSELFGEQESLSPGRTSCSGLPESVTPKATAVPATLTEKEMALAKHREAREASPCH